MSVAQEAAYLGDFPIAAEATSAARLAFIRKTYAHLTAAVFAFVAIEAILFNTPIAQTLIPSLFSGYGYLIVFVAFIFVSYLAQRWAQSATSVRTQYMGLGLYVVAESIIFLPILYIANLRGGANIILTAALLTLLLFTALTVTVFVTRKDFSFLRAALGIGSIAALGIMVLGIIFGFNLGLGFVAAMLCLACGYVLYDTSNVLHHYRVGQHVAASLALFASIALMFWYVLRLLMILQDRR